MEERISIYPNIFVSMFIAISYIEEQRLFDYWKLRDYLLDNIVNEDEYYDVDKLVYLDNLLYKILLLYKNKGLINSVSGYFGLFRISNNIDYIRIINNNYKYLNDMRDFFYRYNNGKPSNILIKFGRKKTVKH